MTLSSLSLVVFVNPYQGINDVCLVSSLKICDIFGIRRSSIMPTPSHHITNRLMLELIGGEPAHTYLQTCIVSQTMDPGK